MKYLSGSLLLIGVALAFSGCSTDSIWIGGDTVTTQTLPGRFPAHTNKVFLTDAPLPASVKYESLGPIDAGKVTTCGTEDLLILMANKCRRIGADAVINLKTWRQASGWKWNGPQGSGEVVRIADTNSLVGLTGYWY